MLPGLADFNPDRFRRTQNFARPGQDIGVTAGQGDEFPIAVPMVQVKFVSAVHQLLSTSIGAGVHDLDHIWGRGASF